MMLNTGNDVCLGKSHNESLPLYGIFTAGFIGSENFQLYLWTPFVYMVGQQKQFQCLIVLGTDHDVTFENKGWRSCYLQFAGSRPVPIHRISGEVPVLRLLDLFIKRRAHMFLVEDEYGQTAGIVTLEDAVETLLGREIMDESDTVEDMQELARSKYRGRLRESR